jgi:anti-sigma regulatory factor (Ser/Thr protein kinase)
MPDATMEGHMVLSPDSRGLYAARERIRSVTQGLRLASEEADHLLIAVGEAISNAYRHGTPDPSVHVIRLSWHHGDEGLVVTIKDDGRGFRPNPQPRRPGNLARGIELMRTCADEVHMFSDEGTKVVLHKRVKLIPDP